MSRTSASDRELAVCDNLVEMVGNGVEIVGNVGNARETRAQEMGNAKDMVEMLPKIISKLWMII